MPAGPRESGLTMNPRVRCVQSQVALWQSIITGRLAHKNRL